MFRAMVRHQQPLQLFTDVLGMVGNPLKETARTWFAPIEMKCLQNQPIAPLGRPQPNHCADDRSIAVPPKNRALHSQRIEHQKSLLGSSAMKIDGRSEERRVGKEC